MSNLARTVGVLALLLALPVGCHHTPSDVVTPDPIGGGEALDGNKQKVDCLHPGVDPSPLVVDLSSADRLNLETALSDGGLVAVSYGCKGLHLLQACQARGKYGFKGATLKEQVVKLESTDEIHANLPSLGAVLPAQLSADIARGATIDVALAMVGKMRATSRLVGRDDLEGDCDGATHFIRGATVGAFAMTQGTHGQVKSAAKLFASVNQDSRTQRSMEQKDGKREKCASSTKATEAPEDCGAILRIDLRELVAGKAPAEAGPTVEIEGCPQGMVFDVGDGKCRATIAGEGHQCAYPDEKDCRAQCEAGHAGSCYYLGSILMDRGDLAGGAPYFKTGCDAGIPLSCHNYAYALYEGAGVTQDYGLAMKLFTKVCDGGDAIGCSGIAILYAEGKGVTTDVATAVKYYEQACNGGDQEYGCPLLARLLADGAKGVEKNVDRARKLLEAACDAGSRNGCLLLRRLH